MKEVQQICYTLFCPLGIENYAKAHYNKYNLVYNVHKFYGKECEMHAGSF